MIIANLAIQFLILVVQISLVYIIVFHVFKFICKGSIALALFITLLEGFSSMSYGKQNLFRIHLIYSAIGSIFETLWGSRSVGDKMYHGLLHTFICLS